MGNNVILEIVIGYPPTFKEAPASRGLFLFKELLKYFPNTFLIMKSGGDFRHDNIIQIPYDTSKHTKYGMLYQLGYIFLAYIRIIKTILSNPVSVCIIRGYDTALLFPILKLFGIYVVYDFHGFVYLEQYQKGRKLRSITTSFFEYICLSLSNAIITTTDGFKSQIYRYSWKCISIPNGIDRINKNISSSYNIMIPRNKRTIVFIGNWEQDMKIEDICESMKYLRDCICYIIGHGYNANKITEKYLGYDNIVFTGRIDPKHAYEYLKKADVCILPYDINSVRSQIYGLHCARKTIEYLYFGKPIIVSNVPAKESFLVEYENCLLYDSGNPKDLANRIATLLNNGDLYNNIRANNLELSKKFFWDILVKNSGLIEIISHSAGPRR